MQMLLTAQDRVILINILSMEGTIAEVSLNLDIYNKIKFDADDQAYLDAKAGVKDFTIDKAEIRPMDVCFSESERQRVIAIFEKLSAQGKVNILILPLYRKFIDLSAAPQESQRI